MAGAGYLVVKCRRSRAARWTPMFSRQVSPFFFLRDRFLGLSGSLAGRAPEASENGAVWTVPAGAFGGTGAGGVQVTGLGAGGALALVETGHADGEIRLGVRSPEDGEGIGLAFRVLDAGNLWLAAINLVNREFVLQKWVNGSAVDVNGTTVPGLEADALQWIGVRLNGDNIRAQLNGGSDLEAADSFNAAAAGFGLGALCLGSFEEISAAPLGAAL